MGVGVAAGVIGLGMALVLGYRAARWIKSKYRWWIAPAGAAAAGYVMAIIVHVILVHATIVKYTYYKIICYSDWLLWVELVAVLHVAVAGPVPGAAVLQGLVGGSAAEPG